MSGDLFSAVVGAAGGLIGGLAGASISFWVEKSKSRIERAKFLSQMAAASEVEKARILAYTHLWGCFEGLSTRSPKEMAANLPRAQNRMQDWYYRSGGGLILAGSDQQVSSTKAAFFAVRDLKSSEPSEIWRVCHELRRCLRRDLKIYDSDEDEQSALRKIKERLKKLEG